MAKCKGCKTNIPDGTEYCTDCQDKKKSSSNESYLDSLLNSVKNSTPPTESIYKKKNGTNTDNNNDNKNGKSKIESGAVSESDKTAEPDLSDYLSYKVDLGDIKDFDEFFMEDDLNDISDDLEINDERLFGKDISDILSDKPKKADTYLTGNNVRSESPEASEIFDQQKTSLNGKSEEKKLTEQQDQSIPDTDEEVPEDTITTDREVQPEEMLLTDEDMVETFTDGGEPNEEVYYSAPDQVIEAEEEDIPEEGLENNFNPGEIAEFETEEDFDSDLNALLNSLDTFQSTEPQTQKVDEDEPKPAVKMEFEPAEEEFEQIEQEEDDFLSLLNQISSDDPVAGDVKEINDLLGTVSSKAQPSSKTPSDVGEVFSDALKVVSTLNDADEEAILKQIPDVAGKKGKKAKKEKKKKATKGKKGTTPGEEVPKIGLFKRLFGNVKDEKTAAESKNNKAKAEKSLEKAADEAKEPEKKGKAKKPKKGASAQTEEEIEGGKGSKGKAAEGKDKKQEKKEKKKKTKEIIQVIDEIEEDEGRINRLGATIVFIFFGLLTALLLVGTNMVSYTLSIQNATNYFDRQKYTEAYNEVYGMDINDEDIEIYDKIMTVMFVNKQLNSYNNYYSLGMYPEALDSLLKGLKRYDKYIELATMLGIKTDLDYVRSQLLAELKNVFKLSEEDAIRINSYPDSKEYSLEVYNAVLENMSN